MGLCLVLSINPTCLLLLNSVTQEQNKQNSGKKGVYFSRKRGVEETWH